MPKIMQSIGRCVDDSISQATEEWFRQHGGMRDREEAFANGISEINAAVQLEKGGRVAVHVVITARNAKQNHVDYQRYQRVSKGEYTRVLKAVPKV